VALGVISDNAFVLRNQTSPSHHCKFWQLPKEIVKKIKVWDEAHDVVLNTNLAIHIFHFHFSHFPFASGLESGFQPVGWSYKMKIGCMNKCVLLQVA